MLISERLKIVPVLSDGDLNAGATLAGDSINMKNYHSVLFIVGMQTLGGAANYIKVYSGATDGATTTALTFRYAFGGAAAGSATSDVYTAWATSSNLSVAHATYDNFTLLIEVEAAAMGAGHNWLTFQCEDTDTGATGNVQVHAILVPRYAVAGTATT